MGGKLRNFSKGVVVSVGPTDQTIDKREGGVDTVYALGGYYNSLSKARIFV